jgi:hypothetical protein
MRDIEKEEKRETEKGRERGERDKKETEKRGDR